MAKRTRRLTNIVPQIKDFAEAYLKQGQAGKTIPSRFSGFLSAKVNGYIHVYQFSNNHLIGSVIVHAGNIPSLKQTIDRAALQIDLGTVTETESEEETIEQEESI